MKLRKIVEITFVTMAFAIAASAAAKAKNSADVLVPYEAAISGAHLGSGRYHVEWQTHSPTATVTFHRGNDVVATANGTVVDRKQKYTSNEVVYDEHADGSRVIQEIRFAGSSEVIVFNE
jgi:hypothetical protein